MRRALILLLFFVPVAFCTGADPGGDRSDGSINKAEGSLPEIWIPREYGWGADKHAPALRVSDYDRETPARDRPEWIEWRATLGSHRTYRNTSHEELHARIFEQTEVLVEKNRQQFERGEVSYRTGVNALADLTEEEFGKMTMKSDVFKNSYLANVNATVVDQPQRLIEAPIQFDWRDTIKFNPVKNQLNCGSCYAFSTIGAIEANLYWKKKISVQLSEQFIVDCSWKVAGYHNSGCDGGWMPATYGWLGTTQIGIPTSANYPYTSGTTQTHGSCRKDTGNEFYKVKKGMVLRANENALREVMVEKGPLEVAIYAGADIRGFKDYRSGVFDDPKCRLETPNHAVLAVAYGVENGKEFWTIRNSWGQSWGQGGYMKLARGKNMCGIVTFFAVWPVLEE